MIKHPLTWTGVLASAGWAVIEVREQAPVLNRVSVIVAWTMIPLGLAVAIVAGWAALRAKGRSDADPPAVLPLDMAHRTSGVILGLLYPALLTVGVQAGLLAWTSTRNPVTTLVWTELVAGPVFVLTAGTVATATARWLPYPATPLLTALAVGGLLMVFPYQPDVWGRRIGVEWLSPLAWPQDIIPYELAFRPAGRHLAYLTGLVLAIAGIAIASKWRVFWVLIVTGSLLAFSAGTSQLAEIPDAQQRLALGQLIGDRAPLSCEIEGHVEYCAMPGYAAWIPYWVEAVDPVVRAAPDGLVTEIAVRQYPVHAPFLLEAGMAGDSEWWWIQPAADDLAARARVVPVGSMWWGNGTFESFRAAEVVMDCTSPCEGESQRLVKTWLASHVAEIRANIEESMAGRRDGAAVVECMLADLWVMPEASDLIGQNWPALTNPTTTYEDAGALMGISVPTGEDEYGYLAGGCP